MNSPHEILGISSNSTLDQIEAAFQEKSEYWRRLQSNSQRSAEAKAMLEQVMAAYDFLRTQAQSPASGLEYREPQAFDSHTGGMSVDQDSCPHCGHKGNPPDARFCLNLNCRGQLFQLCPSCHRELPWHYQSCHQCGANIEQVHQEQERQQQLKEIELFRHREQQLEEINRQITSLTAVEARIRPFHLRGVLQVFSKKSELNQWAEKNGAGFGTQLANVVLGGISFAISVGVGTALEDTLGVFAIVIWLTLFLALSGGALYFFTLGPQALEAIAQERMKLECEKHNFVQISQQ